MPWRLPGGLPLKGVLRQCQAQSRQHGGRNPPFCWALKDWGECALEPEITVALDSVCDT
jgi:hypothetical protein